MFKESFDRGRARGWNGGVCEVSDMGDAKKVEGGDDGGARPRMGLLKREGALGAFARRAITGFLKY